MISLKQLVEAGVHFGHRTSRWHPKMRPYIWGIKSKTHLIDVSKTAFLLNRSEKFLEEIVAQTGKPVLFIGTKKAAQSLVKQKAEALNMPYVVHRWIGGTLSNFDQVKKAVTRLLHLRDVCAKSLDRYTKKEQSMLQKEVDRLEKNFGGIVGLNQLPAALVVVDAKRERSAIREAFVMNIPVISLVDTNTDPTGISYIIPANDDSPKSINLILDRLAQSIEAGQKEMASRIEKEKAAKAAARQEEKAKKQAAAQEAAPAHKADAQADAAKSEKPVKKAAPKKPAKAPAKKPAAPAKKAATTKKAAPKKPAAEKTKEAAAK